MRRSLRILRRLAIVLVVLGALGLAGFTWFAYWPLEGKVERVEALVPGDVEFLYRTSWTELKAGGFLQRNVVDHPVVPSIDPKKVEVDPKTKQTLAAALDTIPETEAQINGSIPGALRVLEGLFFGTKEFRIEKDLFPAEIVAAGKWCAGGNPSDGPPEWRQLLVCTRVSPLVKFAFEAVKHDFVRQRSVPRDELELVVTPDGLLRAERLRYQEPRRPAPCEGGVVRDSQRTWWVARHLDVLLLSNSEDLLRGALATRTGGERAIDRPQFDPERPEGAIAASIDLVNLRSYMNRIFSGGEGQKFGAFVGKFLAIDALDRTEAVVIPSPDGLSIRADVHYSEERMKPFLDVAKTYSFAPTSVRDGIARFVPQRDTALVAQVKTDPRILLRALFENLSASDRRLIDDRVRDISGQRRADGKTGYATTSEFLDELGGQLGSNTGVAISRLGSVFDKVEYATWHSNADPVPTAVLAVVFTIRDGAKQDEVDEFLTDRVRALGFDPPERVTSTNGLPYSRLRLPPPKPRDYEFVEPAFAVLEGKLILSTREDFLLEILKTVKGETKSVADSEEFRAAMAPLPSNATVALYAHGKTLRDLAWDFRNDHVQEVGGKELTRRLLELRIELQRAKGRLEGADLEEVNVRVDAEADRFRREEYARFIQDYRRSLDASTRIEGAGFVLEAHASERRLNVGASVRFVPPAER